MEEKVMGKTRRIGTLTSGILLILFGFLFLLKMALPNMTYEFIFRLWPVIFISLGTEILLGSRKTDQKFVYDGAAIFLVILLAVFAMGMAGVDRMFDYYNVYRF